MTKLQRALQLGKRHFTYISTDEMLHCAILDHHQSTSKLQNV